MTSAFALFDSYNRQARLYPALLALLPPLIALLAWFPTLLTSNVGITLATLAGSCGLLFVLSVFSRTCGKHTEQRLLKAWGGWPTTQWLRHSDANLSPLTKQRYHQALTRAAANLQFPTPQQEQADPARADQTYQSAVDWLKEHSRDSEFPLVLNENIEYGFRRNVRGIRPFAITVASAAFIASVCGITYRITQAPSPWLSTIADQISAPISGATGLLLFSLFVWSAFVTDAWVRRAGDQYARALLATCDTL